MFDLHQAIEDCRFLIRRMSDNTRQPLEREADYILARMLHLQVVEAGLLSSEHAAILLRVLEDARPYAQIRRFPEDFYPI